MFIDWIFPTLGWSFLVMGCLMGILGALSFRDPRTEVDPLRRAMLPVQNWIPVVLACFMIGFGGLLLLGPSQTTMLALKPFFGVGLGVAGVALASATPPYIHRLWTLVPSDARRSWRKWGLIALGALAEGVSLMGLGGGAISVMPEPSGPAFWAATVVLGLAMVTVLAAALAAITAAVGLVGANETATPL
jgi:hypothetical protein